MFQMILLMAIAMPFDLIREFQISHIKEADKTKVTLTWDLMQHAEYIIVTRGTVLIEVLPGDSTEWVTYEDGYGDFQYSIGWSKYGITFQWETDILSIGRVTWDPPALLPDGYILFASTDLSALGDPTNACMEIEGGETSEVDLVDVMDAGLLQSGVVQYIAMASYVVHEGDKILSELTDPVDAEFLYGTYTIPWAPPQVPINITVGD